MNNNDNNNKEQEEEIKQPAGKEIKVSNEQYNEYLVHLKKEIDALDNEIVKILGTDWKTRHLDTNIRQIAMDVRKCYQNKILMKFMVVWYPSKVEYKQQYKEAASAYLMGWGVFMNEVMTNKIKQ